MGRPPLLLAAPDDENGGNGGGNDPEGSPRDPDEETLEE